MKSFTHRNAEKMFITFWKSLSSNVMSAADLNFKAHRLMHDKGYAEKKTCN